MVAFPAIVLVPGTIEYDTEPRETRVLRTITGAGRSTSRCCFRRERTPCARSSGSSATFLAWNVDRRRGNYALDSKLRLKARPTTRQTRRRRVRSLHGVRVWFRTALDDLNSVP